MNELLDKQVAYAAMFEFLTSYFEITKSDDIGSLLGSMAVLQDGITADPAIWSEWLQCIEKAKKREVIQSLKIKK